MRAEHQNGWLKQTRRRIRHLVKGAAARSRGLEPVHILHIYKTGGTAVKHALDGIRQTPTHVIVSHKHSVGLDLIPRGEKVMFVVRDPVSRFVSGFYDRRREGRPRYNTPWSEAERRTFGLFETPNAIGEALAQGGAAAGDARDALASLDRLSVPWWAWLGTREAFLARRNDILLVGRQETLAQDFERLRHLLSLPYNVTLPGDDIDAHRARNVDRKLSDAARAALRHALADEYAWIALLEREGLLQPWPLSERPQDRGVKGAVTKGDQPVPAAAHPRP